MCVTNNFFFSPTCIGLLWKGIRIVKFLSSWFSVYNNCGFLLFFCFFVFCFSGVFFFSVYNNCVVIPEKHPFALISQWPRSLHTHTFVVIHTHLSALNVLSVHEARLFCKNLKSWKLRVILEAAFFSCWVVDVPDVFLNLILQIGPLICFISYFFLMKLNHETL